VARPRRFTDDQFLDAALALVVERGAVGATVSRIAADVGAPIGSVYHRYASRDVLMSALWLRTIARFQEGYLAALDGPAPEDAAVAAALHVVRWSRQHLVEATLLHVFRPRDLVDVWPEESQHRLAALNARVDTAVQRHAQLRCPGAGAAAEQLVRFAIADVPYAACRRYLADATAPPPVLDQVVERAVRAVLAQDFTASLVGH
jgi:AcrR family transcriptional regulator